MACRKGPKICSVDPKKRNEPITRQMIRRDENVPLRRSSRIQEKRHTNAPLKLSTIKSGVAKIPELPALKSCLKRNSVDAGWRRTFSKYTPSEELTVSPIKASQANLMSVILTDEYVDIYSWVTNMSEQHFYENAFLLLSYSKNDKHKMAKIIHRGSLGVDMSYFNKLADIILLGKGTFGGVYCCRDPKTNIRFAMKHIFGEIKNYVEGVKKILSYLAERNASIRAMDSPFVVKFYYSLLLKSSSDLYLFYEFCIGDLYKYIKAIGTKNVEAISKMVYSNNSGIVKAIYKDNLDLLEAALLYIFELFCGLDFLVRCNIIHQDIKPDNMLISENLHIKLGDFGITYKTRAIHRRTNRVLVHVDDIEVSELQNNEPAFEGTLDYMDLELQYIYLSLTDKRILGLIHEHKDIFDIPDFVYDADSLKPCFLVDTWAAGLIALILLFRGFSVLNPYHLHEDLYPDIPIDSRSLFIINIVGRQSIYTNYVRNGLISGGGKSHKELTTFLTSIFLPRGTRCQAYTKDKEVYHFTDHRKMRYIDMDKVEKLQSFSDRNFNRTNIHLREVSERVRVVFAKEKKPRHATLEELFEKLKSQRPKQEDPKEAFVLDPGMMINFFN